MLTRREEKKFIEGKFSLNKLLGCSNIWGVLRIGGRETGKCGKKRNDTER